VQDREILPGGVEDFPVLHFLPVFDFISYFYQLFLVSCLFDSYVLLADDHVNNVTYFPFMSIKKVFLCIARRLLCNNMADCSICMFIKD
jgi:5'(3')-deoxyribonucleotidase